jgi:hypothetical protein
MNNNRLLGILLAVALVALGVLGYLCDQQIAGIGL